MNKWLIDYIMRENTHSIDTADKGIFETANYITILKSKIKKYGIPIEAINKEFTIESSMDEKEYTFCRVGKLWNKK